MNLLYQILIQNSNTTQMFQVELHLLLRNSNFEVPDKEG